VKLWPCNIIPPKTKKDWSKLRSLAHLLTQRVCLGVGVLHLGRCDPSGHLQGRTKSNVQGHGLLGTRRRLWQGLEQLDPSSHMADGFQIGRAVAGALAGPLPVGYGRLRQCRFRVVMRQQLGLGLGRLGKEGL
jgi:hypothetical protein